MTHLTNATTDAALREARREQRRIAILNQPHSYKLTPLEPRGQVANDDSLTLSIEKAADRFSMG
jgi:hypothetical protein